MDKEIFMKEFYEEKIFNELKDIYFGGIREIKKRYHEIDIDYSKVYRKIINYRISKYGTSYISPPDCESRTREDITKKAIKRKNARYKRRKRESEK